MQHRTYSVFYRERGQKRYNRLSGWAYKKSAAVRLWQNWLLAGSFAGLEMALRPATEIDFNMDKSAEAIVKMNVETFVKTLVKGM